MGSHEKGPFKNWPFHSKLAQSMDEIARFHGNPSQNPKLRGGGFGRYIRLLGVGHLRNLARSSTNRDGFASKILKSGP